MKKVDKLVLHNIGVMSSILSEWPSQVALHQTKLRLVCIYQNQSFPSPRLIV